MCPSTSSPRSAVTPGARFPASPGWGGKDWTDPKDQVRKAVAAVAQQVVALHRRGEPRPPAMPL